jgi:hypothetical protein
VLLQYEKEWIPYFDFIWTHFWPDFAIGGKEGWCWFGFSIFVQYWWVIACIFHAIFLKYLFFRVLGLMLGLEYMSAFDEFWLLDWPANPINVPSFLIFKRPKISHQKVLDFVFDGACGRKSNINTNKVTVKL